MAKVQERESGVPLFSEEEMSEVSGLKLVDEYVEVTCGCTSHRYGDAVGRLRVFSNGYLEISCECTPGCTEDKLSPSAFEKHSGRETARKWKNNIWVIINGEKVPLYKTMLLKYYNQVSKAAKGSNRSKHGRACHRDEFVRCSRCDKERRFRLRTKEECRIHHDAMADANWKCSDLTYDKLHRNYYYYYVQTCVLCLCLCIFTHTKNHIGCYVLQEAIIKSMFSELHATTKKNEQAAEFTGDAVVLRHAKVALLVCALDVIFAAFQIAAARFVLTSQAMPNLESFN